MKEMEEFRNLRLALSILHKNDLNEKLPIAVQARVETLCGLGLLTHGSDGIQITEAGRVALA